MKSYLSYRIKFLSAFLLAVLLFSGVIAWLKYPFGVNQYKTISLGMESAEKPGDLIGWGPLYPKVPEEFDFFVYSLGDKTKCIQSDCGMGGYFIDCLYGWISGYKDIGEVRDYGLRDAGIDINKQKIITIADKNAKIVGIYPGTSIRNLPYIMRNHRDLVSPESFKMCSNILPSRWK